MKKLDNYGGQIAGGDLAPSYLFEEGDKAYHLDLVKWDDKTVAGNINKVVVTAVEGTTNMRVQWLTCRIIAGKRPCDERVYTTNYRLFLTKQEAKEFLYKRLQGSKEHFQDLLNMIEDCIIDLDMDDELVDQVVVQ